MELPMDSKESWQQLLEVEFAKPYYQKLLNFVTEERQIYRDAVYPPAHQVFEWTRFCEVNEVKVVIVGQDPYPDPGKAHGLAFSVPCGVPLPQSLLNIYKELENDVGFKNPGHGFLKGWAEQGVLLLNTFMTFRQDVNATQAKNFHKTTYWKTFTNNVLSGLIESQSGIVFMLWGEKAQGLEVFQNAAFLEQNKHLILTAAHPSPLSAYGGFFGCKHFSRCNQHLATVGKTQINWNWLPAL